MKIAKEKLIEICEAIQKAIETILDEELTYTFANNVLNNDMSKLTDNTIYVDLVKNFMANCQNKSGVSITPTYPMIEALIATHLMLVPIANMKADVENRKEKIDDAIVAVYGASAIPLKRRIDALIPLSKYVNFDNGVFFSGGKSWTSIVPTSNEFAVSDEELDYYLARMNYIQNKNEKKAKDYSTQEKELIRKRLLREKIISTIYNSNYDIKSTKNHNVADRIKVLMQTFPEIKEALKKQEEAKWNEYLKDFKSKYAISENDQLPEFTSYEEMYKNSIEKERVFILNQSSEKQKYYDIYKKEKKETEANETDFSEKWLPEYLDNNHFKKLALHSLTEVDIMKIASKNLNLQKIIEDREATNSKENAVNTVIEFLKLKLENPNLKNIIVVSEWQYLLRQVLTTQKVVKDISIIKQFINHNNITDIEKIEDNKLDELSNTISLPQNTIKQIIELQKQATDKGITDFESIDILAYPADKEKNVVLSSENISSFTEILSTDCGKIQDYKKDTGNYSIPKTHCQADLFNELFPNIIVGKKTLSEYLIDEYQNSNSDFNIFDENENN